MTISHPYGAYAQAAEAVAPNQQLLMLYDGAANFVKQAKEALIEKNFEERFNLLNKACAIVNGLSECVDHNIDAQMASVLQAYYVSLDQRIIKASYTDDLALFDAIVSDIKSMRESWAEAIETTAKSSEDSLTEAKEEGERELEMEGQAEGGSSTSASSKNQSFLGSDFSA
jgi:flagellar protein FliS